MRERNDKKNYNTYLKAAYATVFTIGSFLFAKSTGYLFGNSDVGEENKENIEPEKNKVDLRRSIDQAINQTVNQETPQSLQLINATPAGKFAVPNLQDMIIKNNIAYVAAGADGFKVLDITNINNSIQLGKYQLTNGFAHQLTLQGNYAYVAYGVTGLRIIDILNPSNLSLAGVYMLGTTNPPVTKVAVTGNAALVVDGNTGELEWVDVTQPMQVFKVYLSTLGVANDVSVAGGIAYVAAENGLQLIDVSNPRVPNLLSNFNTGFANGVNVVGSIAYVADYYLGLQLIDVSNPRTPSWLGNF